MLSPFLTSLTIKQQTLLPLPAHAPHVSLPSEAPAPASRQDPTAAEIPPSPRRGDQPGRCFSSSALARDEGEAGLGQENRPSPGGEAGGEGRAEPGAGCTASLQGGDRKARAHCAPLPATLSAREIPLGPDRSKHSPAGEARPPRTAPSLPRRCGSRSGQSRRWRTAAVTRRAQARSR